MTRIKVTTEVDETILLQFKVCNGDDKPSMKALLEKGMLEYLKGKDPVKALDIEIELDRKALDDKIEYRARMRILEPQQKRTREFEEKQDGVYERAKFWFIEDPDRRAEKILDYPPNWKRLKDIIGAKSEVQAMEILRKIATEWRNKGLEVNKS